MTQGGGVAAIRGRRARLGSSTWLRGSSNKYACAAPSGARRSSPRLGRLRSMPFNARHVTRVLPAYHPLYERPLLSAA